jgi:hypothetical protein
MLLNVWIETFMDTDALEPSMELLTNLSKVALRNARKAFLQATHPCELSGACTSWKGHSPRASHPLVSRSFRHSSLHNPVSSVGSDNRHIEGGFPQLGWTAEMGCLERRSLLSITETMTYLVLCYSRHRP